MLAGQSVPTMSLASATLMLLSSCAIAFNPTFKFATQPLLQRRSHFGVQSHRSPAVVRQSLTRNLRMNAVQPKIIQGGMGVQVKTLRFTQFWSYKPNYAPKLFHNLFSLNL